MAGPYNTGSALNYVGVGKQTVLGTAVPPTLFVPYTGDVTVDHGMEGDDVREGGTGPYLARSVKTKHGIGGGFGTPWRPSTGAKLAAWFLGSDAVAAAGSLFAHTATPAEPPIYLSVETNQSDEIIERAVDSMFGKFTITGPEANGELMVALEYAGAAPTIGGTATTEVYESGVHGVTAGAPWREGDGVFTVAGAVITNLVSWELALDWGLDTDIYTSKVTRNRVMKLILTGEITIRTLEVTPDDYRTANYGSIAGTAAGADFPRVTTNAFVASYTNGLATTNLRTLDITVPELNWKSAPRKLQAAGEAHILERKGQIVKGAGNLITVVSTNADTLAY